MELPKLKTALKSFFARYNPPSQPTQARLKSEAMASFRAAQNRRTLHRWVFWQRTAFSMVLVLTVSILGVMTSTISPNRVKAGTLLANYGPVEIIRGEKSFLVRDEADIFVGDLVRVGNRGEATLNLKNQAISSIEEKTHLIITDTDALFIEKGRLNSEAFNGVEVATDRGLVRTTPGAIVSFDVSETGQTKISTEKNIAQVFDLQNGQALIGQGEEVILHSDTQLNNQPVIKNETLSSAQIEALKSKLIITRSKLLTAIEGQMQGQRKTAKDEFVSAEQSFKSLSQVLLSSRELEIARRKNFDSVEIENVYMTLAKRINHSTILAEVDSLAQALAYFQNLQTPLDLELAKTGNTNLDRYLLLKRIAEKSHRADQIAFESLATKYVVNFLQPIQNKTDRNAQIAELNATVADLPDSADTYYFLRRVALKMSPELATAMDKAIGTHF